MEAAADVLLGMAAEKIQALVIHLCTSAHTHTHTHTLTHTPSLSPPFAFSHSLSLFLTHTHTHTHTQIYTISFPPSLCLSQTPSFLSPHTHPWHSATPTSSCCPLPLFILHPRQHSAYLYSSSSSSSSSIASWDSSGVVVKGGRNMQWFRGQSNYQSYQQERSINTFPVVSILIYKRNIYSVFRNVLDADYWCASWHFLETSHTALPFVFVCFLRLQIRLIDWSCFLTEGTHMTHIYCWSL